MQEKEYTIDELTQELGICKMTAYKLLRNGRIKARKKYGTTKKGDTWLIPQSSVDEYKLYRTSRCACPKIMWINLKCEYCGTEGCAVIVSCSNCNSILYNKSYNNNQIVSQENEEILIRKEIPNLCPICKSRLNNNGKN